MEVGIEVRNLAIYVHIPFCKQKCKYCDFNSFFTEDNSLIESYINAVCKQLVFYSEVSKNFCVSSVYFGGGTPSFIAEKYIMQILNVIKDKYNVKNEVEITIEANPGTVNLVRLKNYRDFGINRLSFGVQTLNDRLLKDIGRVHSAGEAINGFYLAREAGFDNISLDIMFGLPSQGIKDVENTVDEFIKLNPEHISAYSLKIEENTVFGKLYREKKLTLPDEATERDMYYIIKEKLFNAGYIQYEISNFAKCGYESKHNTSYWLRQDYLGMGISSASCFNEVRFTGTADFKSYIENPIENFSEYEVLTDDVIASERIILGLRLTKGVTKDLFVKPEWIKSCEELIKKGLLVESDNRIFLSDKGLDLANQVFVEFI